MTELAQTVRFQAKSAGISADQVWEYEAATRRTSHDVIGETIETLNKPEDFPPIEAAIVPGDTVALAVDPNVPQIDAVVEGALRLLRATDAERIEVVLWDEATAETISRVEKAAGDHLVLRHQSDDRESLCYLAADDDAAPIYLNRAVVDADFVLPVVAVRPSEVAHRRDVSGIFPSLCDSATRTRFDQRVRAGAADKKVGKTGNTIAEEVPWLLGVQVALTVAVNSNGQAGEIKAGTLASLSKLIKPPRRGPDPVPPPASLVVAALDGDGQQQTWANVVRAARAAMDYAEPDATIVVWSSLDQPPVGGLLAMEVDGEQASMAARIREIDADGLPAWDATEVLAGQMKDVTSRHRVMLHCRLPREVIEPIGLGVVDSAAELANLSRTYSSCGVLRAAQFAGGLS